MVNPTTTEATPPINVNPMMAMAGGSGTAASSSAAAIVGHVEVPRVQFPLPSPYWSTPGEQPNFRMWWKQVENYVFWLDTQRGPANPLSGEYKNRLLFSLLGAEAITRFGTTPSRINWSLCLLLHFPLRSNVSFNQW